MMFGSRDEFEYFECAKCLTIQISEIPSSLQKYYPVDYYSMEALSSNEQNQVLGFLKRQRGKYCTGSVNPVGLFVNAINRAEYYQWSKQIPLSLNHRILDVGCGTGRLLLKMQSDGFKYLTGVDPNIESEILYDNGVRILKTSLEEVSGKYDGVMFHHSFEHMPDPLCTMRALYKCITKDSWIVIRLPLIGGYTFRRYGVNWVGLDAPRHLFSHSLRGLQYLCNDTGFQIISYHFEPSRLVFWASELYSRDIPMIGKEKYPESLWKDVVSSRSLRAFDRMSRSLNRMYDGDLAVIYLKRK